MIDLFDDTCPPTTPITEDTRKTVSPVDELAGIQITVIGESEVIGTLVKPTANDEDCPGARKGDGCE